MTDATTNRPDSAETERDGPPEKLVYVVPGAPEPYDDDSIDLSGVWSTLWNRKWIIAAVTAVFALASIPYALAQTDWYRADVLLAPAGDEASSAGIAGQLGSIAGLAGISLSGGGSNTVEALAVLQSRDFTRAFVEEENLLTILFADRWDSENGRWIDDDPETWPDSADAARFFGTLRRIVEDRQTGLVTVAIEWTDPELAALWVTRLVERLNEYMRALALAEAQANLEYLETQMSATSVVALQQAMASLLEREHQTLMLAQGNDEFAFRVIDSAEVPETPSRPNRRLIVVVVTLLGAVLAAAIMLVRNREREPTPGAA